jgi:hypothetical protein
MPRPKKEVKAEESEEEKYEKLVKKLLRDPRFKQYKMLFSKSFGGSSGGGRGGRGGRTGGRSQGMIQTPNQDNFIKIHASILDMNSKLSDLSSQMKRGGFNPYLYMQGYQGNSQGSLNINPPEASNTPQSIQEHRLLTARTYQPAAEHPTPLAIEEAAQGNIEHSPHIRRERFESAESEELNVQHLEDVGTQTTERMYDTREMLGMMSANMIQTRLRANNIDPDEMPTGLERLRSHVNYMIRPPESDIVSGKAIPANIDLTRSDQRGRPRKQAAATTEDPIIEQLEED